LFNLLLFLCAEGQIVASQAEGTAEKSQVSFASSIPSTPLTVSNLLFFAKFCTVHSLLLIPLATCARRKGNTLFLPTSFRDAMKNQNLIAKGLLAASVVSLGSVSCSVGKTSKPDAFEVRRGNFTNRLYAAYDPVNPLALTWLFCRDESIDTNFPTKTVQVGDLPLGVRIAQALNKTTPLDESDAQNQLSTTSTAGAVAPERARTIRITERTTLKDFAPALSAGGCKRVQENLNLTESKEKVGESFVPKADLDSTVSMFSALASCTGFVVDTLLIAGIVSQRLRGLPPTEITKFGFKKAAVDKSNIGSTILGWTTSATFCSFSTRGLFSKVSEKFTLTGDNRAELFKYFDKVSQRTNTLLKSDEWSQTLSSLEQEKLSQLKNEIVAQETAFREAQSQLKSMSPADLRFQSAALAYAAAYNPLFVSVWNSQMAQTVYEDSTLQGNVMNQFLTGINTILSNVSKFLSGQDRETQQKQ
jgi:hypothetical protein